MTPPGSQICLKSTYFTCNSEFYEQMEGAAMESPVSAIVANSYMEFFEKLALELAPLRPRLWKRYVDDTCCIMQKDGVEELFKHRNITLWKDLQKEHHQLTTTFQTQWLPFSFYLCHLLHTETTQATRGVTR